MLSEDRRPGTEDGGLWTMDDGRRATDGGRVASGLSVVDKEEGEQMYKFEKLEVWQLSLEYLDLAYSLSDGLPRHEDFNLKSQIRRAATSIALNIAEGSTGQTDAEQARFVGLAIWSLMEVVACQRIVSRRGYPTDSADTAKMEEMGLTLVRKLQAMRTALDPSRKWAREPEEAYLPDAGGALTGE